MKERSRSKSFLFLTELCIAILFFAITCAVCVQMYGKAKIISNQSRDLANAVNICENIASLVKADQTPEQIAENLSDASQKDGSINVFYDDKFNTTTTNPSYKTKVTFLENEGLLNVTISVQTAYTQQEVYTLCVSTLAD